MWPLSQKLSCVRALSWSMVLRNVLPSSPTPPAFYRGPHPAVVLTFSALLCIVHHPALVRSGADWDMQGCQGTDVHLMLALEPVRQQNWEQEREKKNYLAEIWYIQSKTATCSVLLPNLLSLFIPLPPLFHFSLPSSFGSLLFSALLSCKVKLVSTKLLILVSDD